MVVCTDHCLQADVIFTIEGTAINGAYINDLKTNYIIPSLEYFGQGNVVEEINYLSESTNSMYGMVVYQAADCLPSPSTDAMGPFSSPSKLMQAFEKLELIGGKGESHANIAEGLATALACFEELQQKRDTANNVQKHCILVCNSPPYLLPVMESQTYAGKTAEQLAAVLQERGIHLSIISPRKIPSLYKIFEKAGGDLTISQTKNYAKDPRHLVLLKGYSLKERPLTPPSGSIPSSLPLQQPQPQLPPNLQPTSQQQQQQAQSQLSSAPHTIASMPSPLPNSSTDNSGMITQQAQMPPNIQGGVGPMVGANTVTSTVMNQMPPGGGVVGPGLALPPSIFRNNAGGMPQMTPGMPGMPPNPGMMNPNMVNTVRGGMVGFPNNPMQGPPGYPGTQGMGQRQPNRWPMLPPGQQPRPPYMANQQVNNPGQSSALIAQLTQPPPNMPGASVNQFPQIGNNPAMTPQQQQQQQQIRINLINQQQQQQQHQQGQQQMMNQGVPGMQQGSNPNQIMQQNQIVTSQAQMGPGPGNPSMVPGRQTIWTGLLEWLEKVKNPADQTKIPQHVPCSVSANVKEGEPELSAESWPPKLIMQLMPKHLIGNIGGAYLKNSKSVLFHPTACEALESLTKVMSNGFAGCVHFTSTVPNPSCDIKVLILLYTPEKKAYLGFIPNDQGAFVDRLRKVIQQQKSTQMMRQGTGGPPGPGQPNQPQGGPQGGPGGVPGGGGTPSTTQNQAGAPGQQQPQQQQQGMMMSQNNPMNPMSGGQMTQQQQGLGPGGAGGPGAGPGMGGPGGPVGPGGPGGGPGGMGGMGQGVGGGPPMGMGGMGGPGGGPVGAGMQPRMRMPGMGQGNPMAPGGAPGGGVNPSGVANPNRNMSPGMMVGGPMPGQQQQQQQQLQVERQANLDKISQLRQTLEAAQQQEQQYKNQLEQISHMKTSQLQEALQLAQQQELQYKILDQQRMANQSQQANAQQQRMMRPVMSNNPGLRHLLQQQPQQYRQQLMGMPNMGGGPRGPQMGQPMQNPGGNQVQFEDVGNFDMF